MTKTLHIPAAATQTGKILRRLADGRWHTVNDIHRHCGYSRLNSRVSDLRRHGYEIECEHIDGRAAGSLAYRYRCTNPPTLVDVPRAPVVVDYPRSPEYRYRLYVLEDGDRRIVGAAPTAEAVGVMIVQLGREGELAGECVGLLDTYGDPDVKGTWLLNPWTQQGEI